MADVDLQVRLNKRIRLSYTAGEDRTVELLLSDGNTLLPVDLTGSRLILALPKADGGCIKRRTAPFSFDWGQVVNLGGMAVFKATSHGLVTGDAVQLQPDNNQTLPAPFMPNTDYMAVPLDGGSFSLVLSGSTTPLALGAPTTGIGFVTSSAFQVANPTMGQAFCRLSAACTGSSSEGQGQTYQLIYTDAQGLTRIYAGSGMLDVMGQADYLGLENVDLGGG